MLLESQTHKTEDFMLQRWQKTHKTSFKSRAMKAFFFIYNNLTKCVQEQQSLPNMTELSNCIYASWDIRVHCVQ